MVGPKHAVPTRARTLAAMTSRYGRPLELGISLVPNRSDLELLRRLARAADELGLDLVGSGNHLAQVERFAREVAPPLRA